MNLLLKKYKRVCVVDTVYTLFLYYLICGVSEDDIFIMSSGIPESIRKNINHIYFPPFKYKNYSNSPITKIKQRLSNIFHRYHILKLRFILFFKVKKNEVEVYGQGHLKYSFPLYEYEKSYLIEDGIGNYSDLKEPTYSNTIYSKILGLIGVDGREYSECFGTHKNIKKVYLTNSNSIPQIIKNKVEVINMKKLWNEKTEDEKNEILEKFNIKDLINQLEENTTLLLTQCLSEDDLIPYDEEINIYKELIEKQENKNIIIKTHPRERKDYSKIFPEITVIDKPFPLEILKCANVKINKIVTVSSNVALTFKGECEIKIYNGKTSSKELNESMKILNERIEN